MTATQYHGTARNGTPITAIYLEQRTANVAVALVLPGDGMPRIAHWGRPLNRPETVLGLYDALNPQQVDGALDFTPWPSVLPTQAEAWTGASRLVVRRNDVELFLKLSVLPGVGFGAGGDSCASGVYDEGGTGVIVATDPATGADRVTVTAGDAEQGVTIVWTGELDPSGLFRQKAAIRNAAPDSPVAPDGPAASEGPAAQDGPESPAPLSIGKIELAFPVPATASELFTTTGHHLRERSPQRQPFQQGRLERVSMVGRPDFDASLIIAAGTPGFGFERGDVYAVHTAWSGNSLLSAERIAYAQGLLSGAELLFGGEVTLPAASDVSGGPGTADESGAAGGPGASGGPGTLGTPKWYETPWVVGSYGDGLNEVAQHFHSFLRARHALWRKAHGLPAEPKPRPVILNTWEAVYFNHNFVTLKALADKAKSVGVERFVVDDGWFGSRRDSRSGLGDWWIAQDVWPDGPKSLKALADYVHGLGMEFGLWFEPEMINPDSDTARAHPDWILAPTPNRLPVQGRSQQVLDLTNPGAFDYVLDAMDGLVGELGVDYIKWDHNKLVTEAVSRFSGRPAVHGETLAVYRIFDTLRDRHPGLEIESCASGGARVDLGILERASRIWASDCVDPVERADIQRYTSLLVPPQMIGEHVGVSPAETNRRTTPLSMRLAMSFFGHMGIEWDLTKEPEADLRELARWVAAFKEHRDWFATATAVHADCADPSIRVDGMVSADRSKAVYRFTQLTTSADWPVGPIHLPGLDPDAVYHVAPLPVSPDLRVFDAGAGRTPLGWWSEAGLDVDGRALAAYGLRPPSLNPAQAVLFGAVRV